MFELDGKHAVVMGVASADSIAWAIARALDRAGGRVSIGYQQRFRSRVMQLVQAGEVPVPYCQRCDITQPSEVEAFFAGLPGDVDVAVHSIAFARPETFSKPVSELSEAEFTEALVTSSYSLIPLARAAAARMPDGGSILAMTYLGGQRVVANYRLMGIAKAALEAVVRELACDLGPRGVRVNAISAGPVRTLAASQVAGFDGMLATYARTAPLRRAIAADDVGAQAAFLASDAARNITGQVIFVDAGTSVLAPLVPGA